MLFLKSVHKICKKPIYIYNLISHRFLFLFNSNNGVIILNTGQRRSSGNIFLDLIGEVGNISFGAASTAISKNVGRRVNISTPSSTIKTKENFINSFIKPYVLVEVEFSKGLKG